ncbi:hypothetical protein OSB04_015453 [Centaurea solstitialis]|uniref:SWIM-type domain-containing protein n=1 Tax=Centaurea solstitialis TaxID=347529 RepID=A0AA38TJ37_9ASTR|nr:hypothetical protein OSB04_015453 [Centaurea solstitialis]
MSHHRHHHYEPIKIPPLEPINITAIDIKSIVDMTLLRVKQRRSSPEKIDVLQEKEKEPPEKPDEEIVPVVTEPPQESISVAIKSPQKVIPILTEPLHEVVPIIAEPPQELISVVTKSSPVMIEPSQEISPVIPEPPPKPLFEKVKEGTTCIVPTIKTSKYTEPIPRKVSLVSYPYELDEITLVWSRSRPLYVDPFLSFKDQPKNMLYDLMLHRNPEEVRDLHENSRSSSFQVGVTDVDRFRPVLEFFKDFWKPRKRARKKRRIKQQGIPDLAARGYISRREPIADQIAYQISPGFIAEVRDYGYNAEVDMHHRNCTCLKWQVSGLPCGHVITVAKRMGKKDVFYLITQPYYMTELYKATYHGVIKPVGPAETWHYPQNPLPTVLPPLIIKRPVGRPKGNKRRPSRGESRSQQKCPRCEEYEHISSQCPWIPNSARGSSQLEPIGTVDLNSGYDNVRFN